MAKLKEGVKHDKEKLRYDLLPVEPIEELVKILTLGAKKYDDWNWQLVVKKNPDRYYSALMRHIVAWRKGKKQDKETKLHPLAHAMCCLIFLLWEELNDAQKKT